jgi:hypothetical protein
LKLGFDFLERSFNLRLQRKIVSIYLSLGCCGDFGIDFLHIQLVDSQSLLLRFRLNQPLANEIFEHFTLDLVLLITEWNDLGRDRVIEVALRNRLSRRNGHGCFGRTLRAVAFRRSALERRRSLLLGRGLRHNRIHCEPLPQQRRED